VLGFGGRILTNDKKAAKYLNSPESDIYHKSKVLYGINHAKKSIAKENNCYLVEGYTDVLQFHQRGIENVVSSSGTALTSDQIRLINRLTPNITVLFDGDAAGIRASLRGIDLILEQGMNVKVCTFPEGEDPDSFAKTNTLEDLQLYLKTNAKDFISYKASLLMGEVQNDPIKKAELVRDMVQSISRIPDRIKREIYVQECARIMSISEEVLFSTLAQIGKKELSEANKKHKQEKKAFEVIKPESPKLQKVDIQFELERKIIQILLLYANKTEDFQDYVLKENEDGVLVLTPVTHSAKVFEKIFLELQQDETELANENFKNIYHQLITSLHENENFVIDQFINQVSPEVSSEVTSILMEDEKYELHQWDKQNIFVKQKHDNIPQLVNQTILNLRCFLIQQKVNELMEMTQKDISTHHQETLEEVRNYLKLRSLLADKLGKVI
jgi:DNA primase